MQKNRRALFLADPPSLEFEVVATPAPASGEVLVKVELAGICGSDGHRLRGHVPTPKARVPFGHEAVGEVLEAGTSSLQDWAGTPVKQGDRVFWLPAAGCGHCYGCVVNDSWGMCENQTWPPSADELGSSAGFQEFALLKRHIPFFRVPDDVPSEAVVALGCGLPTAVGGMHRLGPIAAGSTVVIQGCGPVGLASTLLAGRSPAGRVVVIGAPAERLQAARELGATDILPLDETTADDRQQWLLEVTTGRGADVVVEASGHLDAFPEGLQLLGRNSRYLILGLWAGAATVPVDPFRLNNLSASIIGSLTNKPRFGYEALRLASDPRVALRLARLVSPPFDLEHLADAIEAQRSGTTVKAVVRP